MTPSFTIAPLPRRILVGLVMVGVAQMCGPLQAQTTPWNMNGSSIWYAPSGINVGIATATPAGKLEILANATSTEHLVLQDTSASGHAPGITFNVSGLNGVQDDMAQIKGGHIGTWTANGYLAFLTQYDHGSGLSERMRIDNFGNVGIGTTTPGRPLDVYGGAIADRDTQSAIVVSTGGNGMNYIESSTNYNSAGNAADLNFTDNFANHTWMTIKASGNVGIGTTNPQQLLDVAGTMAAREIIVTQTGADYVFDPAYRLAPLSEVADYIKENHHLPDVPSAQDMQKNGASVGEMQAKLLAKVEELTLHMIELEQKNRELETQLRQIKAAAPAGQEKQGAKEVENRNDQ